MSKVDIMIIYDFSNKLQQSSMLSGDKPDRSDESCIWARILQMNVRLNPHSSEPERFDRNIVLDGFTLIACGGCGQFHGSMKIEISVQSTRVTKNIQDIWPF